jgi:hypothetical protein
MDYSCFMGLLVSQRNNKLRDLNQWGTRNTPPVPGVTREVNWQGCRKRLKHHEGEPVICLEYEHGWKFNLPEVEESIQYFTNPASKFD